MTNVLHIIGTTGPGGAERIFVELVKGLDASRWRSFTALAGRGWVYDTLVAGGLRPITVPARGAFDVRYLLALCELVRARRIHLIQTHLLRASVYGTMTGALCRVPVVSTFHGQPDLAGRGTCRATKLWLLNRGARRVVFVSESLRRFFLATDRFARDRAAVIPNGIDETLFTPCRDTSLRDELGVGPDELLVGAVGNVRAPKGYDVFLRAAARLVRAAPGYRFVVVGETGGPLARELVALRDALGLRDRFTFAGFRGGIHRVINNFDYCVSSSRSEGFSLSVVEAMACGVPVVATRSGGPQEIITDGDDGLLVDVDAPEQIARAVERLRRDPAIRERLTRAGRALVLRRFTVERMVAAYERLYEQCAPPSRAARRFHARRPLVTR